jgi:hypothetical protein
VDLRPKVQASTLMTELGRVLIEAAGVRSNTYVGQMM